ncbi:hypothetical protein [Vibrio owensii]|uniref:hypothetical protein n=1 Tax=Vibrio owensii TaxID=696485 RepID=UPI0018F26FE5|nr:hypothetical protein [Vibrio owensii]
MVNIQVDDSVFDEDLEWFCESSSIPMVSSWERFDLYRSEPMAIFDTYDFYGSVSTWRYNLSNSVIFDDEFESFSGANDGRSYAEVIFSTVDRLKELILEGFTLVLGISFGKDSSFLSVLMNLAYAELKCEGRLPDDAYGILLHGNTGVENPEVEALAAEQWNQLMDAYSYFDLPIEQVLARPNFGSSFLGRVVGGRGLPTMVTTKSRECSTDWKTLSNSRALRKHVSSKPEKPKLCMLLGSRDEEGSARAASIAKHGGTADPLAVAYQEKHKYHVAYPIKDLKVEHIWELLVSSGRSGKLIPSLIDFDRTVELYADSSSECVMFDTQSKSVANSKPCGSRHGCFVCTANGPTDKSMTELLKREKYGYMKTLSRIREYIIKDHWNWNERGIWGRSIDKYGFARIQPDLYSFKKCRTLLKAMLTADVWEVERAFRLEQQIADGEVPKTPENIRMSKPQFQLVSKEDLLKVDFLWGFHQLSPRPHEALRVYDEVYNKDSYEFLEWVDDMPAVPKTPLPPAQYIYVGSDWSDGGNNPGMVDYMHELVAFEPSKLREPRVRKSTGEHFETMHYLESDSLSFDPELGWHIFNDIDRYLRENEVGGPSTLGAMTYMRMGAVSLKGHASYKFNQMAMRYQWYRYRGMSSHMTLDRFEWNKSDIEERSGTKVLTRKEYLAFVKTHFDGEIDNTEIVLEESAPETVQVFQQDMFSYLEDSSPPAIKVRRARSKSKAEVVESKIEQLSMF